jgi:hypothetical protein
MHDCSLSHVNLSSNTLDTRFNIIGALQTPRVESMVDNLFPLSGYHYSLHVGNTSTGIGKIGHMTRIMTQNDAFQPCDQHFVLFIQPKRLSSISCPAAVSLKFRYHVTESTGIDVVTCKPETTDYVSRESC